jgi:hypothetical protein
MSSGPVLLNLEKSSLALFYLKVKNTGSSPVQGPVRSLIWENTCLASMRYRFESCRAHIIKNSFNTLILIFLG